jgi:hypothetical protein
VIDLHTHSTVSDGSDPPERIPELAATAGCSAVALTDHDSHAGLSAAALSAERCGITLIPGCEVSCLAAGPHTDPESRGPSMHVLVYFVGPGDGPLQEELARLRQDRLARNRRLARRLAELDLPVEYEEVITAAGGIEEEVGRPHFAAALVAAGVARDIEDAFDRFLGEGGVAHVSKARILPGQIAELARASGGVAVLAHPLSLGLTPRDLEGTVRELADAGFGGLEAVYGRYSPRQRAELRALANRVGLVATGGSDYHGSFKPDLRIGKGTGDLDVPDITLEQLAARRP